MSLTAAARATVQQAADVRAFAAGVGRASASTDGAARSLAAGPGVTITVGPGGDRSAENYLRFFTIDNAGSSLPGYGIANVFKTFEFDTRENPFTRDNAGALQVLLDSMAGPRGSVHGSASRDSDPLFRLLLSTRGRAGRRPQ